MLDNNGRLYATVLSTVEGSHVECDAGFTCMGAGQRKLVRAHPDGYLYVDCSQGGHALEGQLSDDGLYYVGLYPAG